MPWMYVNKYKPIIRCTVGHTIYRARWHTFGILSWGFGRPPPFDCRLSVPCPKHQFSFDLGCEEKRNEQTVKFYASQHKDHFRSLFAPLRLRLLRFRHIPRTHVPGVLRRDGASEQKCSTSFASEKRLKDNEHTQHTHTHEAPHKFCRCFRRLSLDFRSGFPLFPLVPRCNDCNLQDLSPVCFIYSAGTGLERWNLAGETYT